MIRDRYEIGCSHCGVVAYAATRDIALEEARRYQLTSHSDRNEQITVFDLMARYGSGQMWRPDGTVMNHRAKKEA